MPTLQGIGLAWLFALMGGSGNEPCDLGFRVEKVGGFRKNIGVLLKGL